MDHNHAMNQQIAHSWANRASTAAEMLRDGEFLLSGAA
jgi:hypothetical protein